MLTFNVLDVRYENIIMQFIYGKRLA